MIFQQTLTFRYNGFLGRYNIVTGHSTSQNEPFLCSYMSSHMSVGVTE